MDFDKETQQNADLTSLVLEELSEAKSAEILQKVATDESLRSEMAQITKTVGQIQNTFEKHKATQTLIPTLSETQKNAILSAMEKQHSNIITPDFSISKIAFPIISIAAAVAFLFVIIGQTNSNKNKVVDKSISTDEVVTFQVKVSGDQSSNSTKSSVVTHSQTPTINSPEIDPEQPELYLPSEIQTDQKQEIAKQSPSNDQQGVQLIPHKEDTVERLASPKK